LYPRRPVLAWDQATGEGRAARVRVSQSASGTA
jgi:hypothetical protein